MSLNRPFKNQSLIVGHSRAVPQIKRCPANIWLEQPSHLPRLEKSWWGAGDQGGVRARPDPTVRKSLGGIAAGRSNPNPQHLIRWRGKGHHGFHACLLRRRVSHIRLSDKAASSPRFPHFGKSQLEVEKKVWSADTASMFALCCTLRPEIQNISRLGRC